MKRFMVFTVAVAMAFCFAGTAMAIDYVVQFDATQDFYAQPVASNGTTVYLLSGGAEEVGVNNANTGATLWQVNAATGVSAVWGGAMNDSNGTSAWGTPVLWKAAGDSGVTLVMNVYQNTPTSDFTGTSLWAVYFNSTGTATTNYGVALDYKWGGSPVGWPVTENRSWTAPLLVDVVSSRATVYGVSGVSAETGASIWAIGLGNQAGSVRLSNNQWSSSTVGVSTFWASPVISGNSLFVLGEYAYSDGSTGTSLAVFDKRKLQAGANAFVGVLGTQAGAASTPFVTPAISGNSLFVLDSTGGLTAYSTRPANLLGSDAAGVVQLSATNATSVSASPVANSTWLVVTANYPAVGMAGVTAFRINRQLNASTGVSWWYEWTGGVTIAATPAISNGQLYVITNIGNDGSAVNRFNLAKHGNSGKITAPDQAWTTDPNSQKFGQVDGEGGPIVIGKRLIFVSDQLKRLYSIDVNAQGNGFWKQFKYDVQKRGNNTKSKSVPIDSDSGCFISTLK